MAQCSIRGNFTGRLEVDAAGAERDRRLSTLRMMAGWKAGPCDRLESPSLRIGLFGKWDGFPGRRAVSGASGA
ncbi:MAG: hypothetical protein ACLQU2_22980, partial [Candidatus Binataceae bacterium]